VTSDAPAVFPNNSRHITVLCNPCLGIDIGAWWVREKEALEGFGEQGSVKKHTWIFLLRVFATSCMG